MDRFKNILVVVDTNASNQDVLLRAVELATRNEAKLKIVDVVREFGWLRHLTSSKYRELEDKMFNDQMRRLQALTTVATDRGLSPTVEVLRGRASTEIICEVLRGDHDLLIKEAKGESWHKGFLGTTATHLLRKCPCPVWITNPGPHRQYERVLATVDAATEDEVHARLNAKILDLATSVCRRDESHLEVVQVWDVFGESLLKSHTSPEEFEEITRTSQTRVEQRCNELLGEFDLSVDLENVHLLHGEPGIVIPEFAQQRKIDLIVMGTVGRTGIAGALMGNTAEGILAKVKCSVLALKPDGFECPVQVEQ